MAEKCKGVHMYMDRVTISVHNCSASEIPDISIPTTLSL